MLRNIALTILLACAALPARAGPMEQALAKLAPQERSQQACILKGLDAVRRDARLRHADRISASVFVPAVLDGTLLTAKGGAIRAGDHWYALSFTCRLTGDLMKAMSFAFALGAEIPKETWDKHGLWR